MTWCDFVAGTQHVQNGFDAHFAVHCTDPEYHIFCFISVLRLSWRPNIFLANQLLLHETYEQVARLHCFNDELPLLS